MALMTYGDISPRTAAYVVKQLLKRAEPYIIIEKFGTPPQGFVLPNNSTKSVKFRRYEALALATTPVVEGVTPPGKALTYTDYTATLVQYGDYIPLTDVIQDTHEDAVLAEATMVLGEQAAQTLETIRWNAIKAGTNVFYANGVARNAVNTQISITLQRKVTRALMRQNARMISSQVMSTPNYNTQPIEAAYIAIAHSDLDSEVRGMTGYINPKQYGTVTPWENEIGSVENVRYLRSTLFTPFADAGGAKGTMLSTSGTSADVYPVIFIARDSYAVIPLKGQNSIVPMVVNPKPAPGDPLGQRGTVGWKAMQTTLILNDNWIARLEVAVLA